MSDIQLGLLIEGEAHRDAIHIAVAPVSSDEQLQPGQRVALVEGTRDRVKASNHATVGIVDPFLRMPVQPGHRFWLCLYIKTVTSLRHEWTHPAFKEEVKHPDYLQTLAVRCRCTLSELVDRLDIHARGHSSGEDDQIHDELNNLGEEGVAEMWAAYEAFRGTKLSAEIKSETYFSCSC